MLVCAPAAHAAMTFAPAASFGTGVGPNSVAIGDLNRDGKPDLAVADNASFGAGSVAILLGTGGGTFATAAVNHTVGGGPTSVAIGDLNGDRKPDLAVTNGTDQDVSVLL